MEAQRNWQNNGFRSMKGKMNVPRPPPAPGSGTLNAEFGWKAPPPPPPPMMSSEMNSSGYPGPFQSSAPPHPPMGRGYNKSSFTYNDLASATGGFAQHNLLGQGGFGYVHKGVLPNGKEIAVKSLKMNSGQGEREFQAEFDIISRVHHRYLVSLVGYCIAGNQRMLVSEYLPNKTLEYHLHHGNSRPTMDWTTRLKIDLGSAKGFAYLHEDCKVYMSIDNNYEAKGIYRCRSSTANILIDNNFEAKVFGCRICFSGKLTDKSDVYSFGIVLLELITSTVAAMMMMMIL